MNKRATVTEAIFSARVLNTLSMVFLATVLVGHIIWAIECWGQNPHFSKGYFGGVGDGMWWALVTATTVGYGDKVPITVVGKTFGYFWLLSGVVFFGAISAEIHSAMSYAGTPISGYESFSNVRICAWPMYVPLFLAKEGLDTNRTTFSPPGTTLEKCLEKFQRVK